MLERVCLECVRPLRIVISTPRNLASPTDLNAVVRLLVSFPCLFDLPPLLGLYLFFGLILWTLITSTLLLSSLSARRHHLWTWLLLALLPAFPVLECRLLGSQLRKCQTGDEH